MTAVAVEALTKSYGQVEAVRAIDFAIETGEVVAILGPNGAGKTTTVEMIEGYRRPDRGRIEVLGHDPGQRDRSWLDRVGIVLQEGGMEEELTVEEAVAAQSRPYSSPLPVDEVVATVGLAEKRGSRIKSLSGGQRRRLDLALAIVGDPDLLFLDEPTTGFDPAARRNSWEAIKRLAEQGTTVVLTTHYLEEAQELANRVIVMTDGRIVANGAPDDLGDRRAGTSTIGFRVDPARAHELGVPSDGSGRVELETDEPVKTIHGITDRALRAGIELTGLEVRRLTLEEAYLRLVTPDE